MSEETRTEQRNMAVSCCKGATVALHRRAKRSEVLTTLTLAVCPSHHTHQLVETGITTGAPHDVKEVKRCITATRSTDKGLQGGAPHLMPAGVQDEAIETAELTPLCNLSLDSLSGPNAPIREPTHAPLLSSRRRPRWGTPRGEWWPFRREGAWSLCACVGPHSATTNEVKEASQ
jgi:hypothetical protein